MYTQRPADLHAHNNAVYINYLLRHFCKMTFAGLHPTSPGRVTPEQSPPGAAGCRFTGAEVGGEGVVPGSSSQLTVIHHLETAGSLSPKVCQFHRRCWERFDINLQELSYSGTGTGVGWRTQHQLSTFGDMSDHLQPRGQAPWGQ
ncbi:hypothetical protein AAFF_G00114440 [Aldrovandia affinis]|uniref:Uncharacterized protein n=1 Tax=Aldrovandia affinis TaxID=143900 RepID=A0AAD7RSV5_9TELE|nr:hypothetical protein AAFF_G00114440 [Aldrovandia affinis]